MISDNALQYHITCIIDMEEVDTVNTCVDVRDICQSSVGVTVDAIYRIPLPEGKKYHMFISHNSKDRQFALDVVEHLESEPYGLKCCFGLIVIFWRGSRYWRI